MPDASISGDAIVGYPGETEEQFQGTVRLVEEVGFDRVNTAAYSPRPGTPAAIADDQVEHKTSIPRPCLCVSCLRCMLGYMHRHGLLGSHRPLLGWPQCMITTPPDAR